MGRSPAVSRVLAAPLLLLAVACGGKKDEGGNSCAQVGVQFEKLARAEAATLPADHPDKAAMQAAESLLPKLRDNLVKECRDNAWSEELRTCFLQAKDTAGARTACKPLMKPPGS
jgi:hypothetical protein